VGRTVQSQEKPVFFIQGKLGIRDLVVVDAKEDLKISWPMISGRQHLAARREGKVATPYAGILRAQSKIKSPVPGLGAS
jgi:hypothetical protein